MRELATGLRQAELANLTVGQVYLEAQQSVAELLANGGKARGRWTKDPIRADLLSALRDCIGRCL